MRKTRKSSDRQKEIFQFIKAFLLEKGYPPSVREIGEAVGLKSSSTVHGYLSRLEANGMIKRDPTKPRAIDILDERPWRQNVPVPMLMGIHKGAALFSERNIRDVYSFPQDMLGTHKKTYLLHMPDDGLQEAGIAEGESSSSRRRNLPMISTSSSRRRRAARSSATSARTRMAPTCRVQLRRTTARSRARMLLRLSHA